MTGGRTPRHWKDQFIVDHQCFFSGLSKRQREIAEMIEANPDISNSEIGKCYGITAGSVTHLIGNLILEIVKMKWKGWGA
jgi:DNA-binding MarR family transcriptional regulator